MRIPVPIGVAALLSLAIAVVTAAACDLSRTWFEVANESDEPLDIMHARAAGLSLRADPARVFTARRMAVRNDLSSNGMAVGKAEAWCEAWQDEAGASASIGWRRSTGRSGLLGSGSSTTTRRPA